MCIFFGHILYLQAVENDWKNIVCDRYLQQYKGHIVCNFLHKFDICKLWENIGRILCVLDDICNIIKGIVCVIFCTKLIFARCWKISSGPNRPVAVIGGVLLQVLCSPIQTGGQNSPVCCVTRAGGLLL